MDMPLLFWLLLVMVLSVWGAVLVVSDLVRDRLSWKKLNAARKARGELPLPAPKLWWP